MKKRIFINLHYLDLGGAERSLIGLLNAIDYSRYDVDLFLNQHRGELLDFVPKQVNILPKIKKYACIESSINQIILSGNWDIALARLKTKKQFAKYAKENNITDNGAVYQYLANATTPLLPSLEKFGKYDLAISFLMPHNIVRDKVCAAKKIAWVHTDYSSLHVNAELEMQVWNSFDKIVSISPSVTKTFLKCFPLLADKIIEIENIVSPNFIRQQADLGKANEMIDEKNAIKLCSVGRFSLAKNFDNIPFICKHLVECGLNIKWYIIGWGSDEALVKKNIEATKMQEHVMLLGKKDNPYPYIKACDIYVQPSRYEGKAITVREAQILCKPVAIANYATAESQVRNGFDGVIIDNQSNEIFAEKLKSFIENKDSQQTLISNMQANNYDNSNEIEKLYNLIS